MTQISLDTLVTVTGGAGNQTPPTWAEIRASAQPHCPQTVARYNEQPRNRAEAQAIGNACIAEMGPLKAGLGGRSRIQSGIDQAFPR